MTRKETIKKVGQYMGNAAPTVNALEALGLITFEEEKKSPIAIIRSYLGYPEEAQQIIDALDSAGYLIVPKHPTC
jgi:hypothetical protein